MTHTAAHTRSNAGADANKGLTPDKIDKQTAAALRKLEDLTPSTALTDFLEGAFNIGAGMGDGLIRAGVGVPGILGDLGNVGNAIAKAVGWADDVSTYDDFKKSRFGAILNDSDWWIKKAGEGADAIGYPSNFAKPVPKDASALRAYARTATEFGAPVGGFAKPLINVAGRLARKLPGRTPDARDLIDAGPDLASFAGPNRSIPPTGVLGALARAPANADFYGAGVGASAGLIHELLDRNPKTGVNPIVGSLGSALLLSLGGRGGGKTPGQFISERLPEEGSDAMQKAIELMEAAKKHDIELSPAEALAAAGDPRMNRLMADIIAVGGSAAPEALLRRRESQGQVKGALLKMLEKIRGGKVDELAPSAAARVVEDAVKGAEKRLIQNPSRPLFEAAKDVEVPQDVIEQLFARAQKAAQEAAPGSERAKAFTQFANNLTKQEMVSQRIPRDGMPVDPKLEPVPQLKIGQLHDNYADLREVLQKKAEGGIKKPQQQLQPLQDDLLATLESSSPEFKEAMDIYRKYSPELEAAKESRVGQIAKWSEEGSSPGKIGNSDIGISAKDFANLMLPKDGDISIQSLKRFFQVLKGGDEAFANQILAQMGEPLSISMSGKGASNKVIKQLVGQMLGARLQEAFNTASAQKGAREYSRNVYFPPDKQEAIKELLREAADAASEGMTAEAKATNKSNLVNGFHRLMETLSATAEFPNVGSPTTGRLKTLDDAGGAGSNFGSAVDKLQALTVVGTKGLANRFAQWGLEGGRDEVFAAMGRILVSPDGLDHLRRLSSRKERNMANSKFLARSFLSSVNESMNNSRDQGRDSAGQWSYPDDADVPN